MNTGDKVLFKGLNNNLSSAWNQYNRFSSTSIFKVYGNALSLLYGDYFESYTELPSGSTANFTGLFYEATNLVVASNLILPSLTCNKDCYNGMFRGCTNLIIGPQLPATYSADGCYSSMFEACINLEEAPDINLTDTARQCCQRMFCMDRNNKITTPNMTKSPVLLPTSGVSDCYKEMFKGNGNLVEVTCMMTTSFQCSNWLANCSDTGTFYKDSSAAWSSGPSGIPYGWTSQNASS